MSNENLTNVESFESDMGYAESLRFFDFVAKLALEVFLFTPFPPALPCEEDLAEYIVAVLGVELFRDFGEVNMQKEQFPDPCEGR